MDKINYGDETFTTEAFGRKGQTYSRGDGVTIYEKPWGKDCDSMGVLSEFNKSKDYVYVEIKPTYNSRKKFYAVVKDNQLKSITFFVVPEYTVIDYYGRPIEVEA